jgi:hypothetical protein
VLQAFESAGFEMQLLKNWGRGTFRGRVKPGPPEFLSIETGEGYYYDVIARPLLGPDRIGLDTEPRQFLSAVLASEEYYQRHGGNDMAWLTSLYHHLLSRAPRPREQQVALERLRRGQARQRRLVLSHLATQPEYQTRLIADCFRRFLGRAALPTEIHVWRESLVQGITPRQAILLFLGSDEYFAQQGSSFPRWLERVQTEILGNKDEAAFPDILGSLQQDRLTRNDVVAGLLARAEGRRYLRRILGRPAFGIERRSVRRLLASLSLEKYYRETGGTSAAWLTVVHHRLLGRAPLPEEENHALDRLRHGAAARRQPIAARLIRSAGYRAQLVAGYFTHYLGRTCKLADVRAWLTIMKRGATEEETLASFLGSEEYFDKHGRDLGRWLEHVHRELLARSLSPEARNKLDALERGTLRRDQVVLGILTSYEYRQRTIERYYHVYLGRSPTAAETRSWAEALRGSPCSATKEQALVA